MRIPFRRLIPLYTGIITSVFIGMGNGGANGPSTQDAQRITINIREMGEKMETPKEEMVFPDGVRWNEQRWNKDHIRQAIAEIQSRFKSPEKIYLLTDSPAPWITLALMEALEPLGVRYLYPRPGGTELEMAELKRGLQDPNYDVVFDIREEGSDVFINLNSDRPEAEILVKHTFDLKNLSKIAIPEIPSGKHVYIHGKGMYCVLVCIAKNYIRDAKSISLASHDSDYICAYSSTDEITVGDVRKREVENNL